MSGDDEPKLHNVWKKRGNLLEHMLSFPEKLRSLHSADNGRPDQLILHDANLDIGICYAWISVLPVGIKMIYTAGPIAEMEVLEADGSVSTVKKYRREEDGSITRLVKEELVISGTDSESRTVLSHYLFPGNADVPLYDDDELLQGVRLDTPEDIVKNYLDVFHDQVWAGLGKRGRKSFPVDVNLPGADYKMSLAVMYSSSGAKGILSKDELQHMMVSVLKDSYAEISHVDYDKFYILGRSSLIDCGSEALFQGIFDDDKRDVSSSELGADIEKCIDKNRNNIFFYSYDGSLCPLIEQVFPDNASVFVYTRSEGIVRDIFEAYVSGSKAGLKASVDPDCLVFSNGLRMFFVGQADVEFQEQEDEYHKSNGIEDKNMEDIWL